VIDPDDNGPNPGSFVLSDKNNYYHGIAYDTARCIHGEENAIGNMLTEEGMYARIRAILVVGPSDEICMPCGMCRVAIHRYKTENTVVLCSNLDFSKIERYAISDLYPRPYEI
jgi:cytidine deaminase